MDRRLPRGHTLLEVVIAVAVMSVLLASVLSIATETYAAVGENEANVTAQSEAVQGMDRLTEVLRKCGWSTAGGGTYPRVLAGGTELEFRVLRDLDGNGYPFSAATGEPEYSPTVYRVALDGHGNLRIHANGIPVWHLCRKVIAASFATYLEDPSLQMREIRVDLQTRVFTRRGVPIDGSVVGSINMRN
jgi:prepilin-type N-terminal cleavage/methylation domain-containing protein